MSDRSPPQKLLLSDLSSDVWWQLCPFLDFNDAERLILTGSRRVKHVLSGRTLLKGLWTSNKFIELEPMWRQYPRLKSIHLRSPRPVLAPKLPISLDMAPPTLLSLRLEFCDCLEILIRNERLNDIFPVLDELELINSSISKLSKTIISVANLPQNLRTLRLNSFTRVQYLLTDIASLPTSLETLDLSINPLSHKREEFFRNYVRLPCPSLTYLRTSEMHLRFSELPRTMTHIDLGYGENLDFHDQSSLPSPTNPSQSVGPFSLKALFPALAYLKIYSKEGLPYDLLSTVPPTLARISLTQWGACGPPKTRDEILHIIDTIAPQIKHFYIDTDASHARDVFARLPNVEDLSILSSRNHITDLSYMKDLTSLQIDRILGVDLTLPPNLTSLRCRSLGHSSVPHNAVFPVFPPTLRLFRCTLPAHAMTTSFILAFPRSLTHLDYHLFDDNEEVWRTLGEHLTELEVLEAGVGMEDEFACPSSAALLPRRIRQMTLVPFKTVDEDDENPETSSIYADSWFLEGLKSLSSLVSLSLSCTSLSPAFYDYLPESLNYLSGPSIIFNHSSKLPRKLETLILTDFTTDLNLHGLPVIVEMARGLPTSLTYLDAHFTSVGSNLMEIVEALPPRISRLAMEDSVVEAYKKRRGLN